MTPEGGRKIAETLFLGKHPVSEEFQKIMYALMMNFMAQWAIKDKGAIEDFKQSTSNIISAAVAETINQLGATGKLPIQMTYTEKEACELLRKGPQYLKSLRASGKPGPKCEVHGRAYTYSAIDLLAFAEGQNDNLEPISKIITMRDGLEVIALTVGKLGNEISDVLKKDAKKKLP